MRFTDLQINNYVKFNEKLKYLYFKVSQDFLWVDEPLECVLEVREIDLEKQKVIMECVDDCGMHAKLDFSEEEYNDMCEEVGIEVLDTSSIAEAMNPDKTKPSILPYNLTVEDNIIIINRLLDAAG